MDFLCRTLNSMANHSTSIVMLRSITRRDFCKTVAVSSGLVMLGGYVMTSAAKSITKEESMTVTLPPLPYAQDALAPHISANTLSFHHGKHHKAYVDKTNELIAGTPLAGASLEEIIKAAAKDEKNKVLFNNAAQVWNHTFYWN